MNMPSSVKVGPHVYSIVRKPASEMEGSLGWCDFNTLEIWVKKGLRSHKAKEILIHELLHTATYPSVCGDGPLTDEDFVTAVAPVLLQILQDNPELVEYLTK